MRSRTIGAFAALVVLTVSAFASPIFGTWKTELNGQPVSVVIMNVEKRAQGKMAIGTGDNVRYLPITNIHFMDAPPMTVQFEVEDHNGAAKLVSTSGKNVKFELHTNDGNEATVRVIEDGKETQTVKAVKAK